MKEKTQNKSFSNLSAEIRKFNYRLSHRHRHSNFFQKPNLKTKNSIQAISNQQMISNENQRKILFFLMFLTISQAQAAFYLVYFNLNNQQYALTSKESPEVLYRILEKAQRCPGAITNSTDFNYESRPVISSLNGQFKVFPSSSNPHPYHLSPALMCISVIFDEIIAEEDQQQNPIVPILFILAVMDILCTLTRFKGYKGLILSVAKASSEFPNFIFSFCPNVSIQHIAAQFWHNITEDDPYELPMADIDLEAGHNSYGSFNGVGLTG